MLKLTSRLRFWLDSPCQTSTLTTRLLGNHKYQEPRRTILNLSCHSNVLCTCSPSFTFNIPNSKTLLLNLHNHYGTKGRFANQGVDELESLFEDEDIDFESQLDRSSEQSQAQFDKSSDMEDLEMQLENLKKDVKKSDLIPFRRDFYVENDVTCNRHQDEISEFYKENSIQVSGRLPPKPVLSFDEIQFPNDVMEKLNSSGFDRPTPIQAVTWPVTLSGRNVVGIAQTGSGKTLSFLLPAMIHMADQPKPQSQDGPISLVLCPTRELAKQCETVTKQYFGNRVRTTCLFGGGERSRQIYDLKRGCDLIVATPGRLMDLLADGQLTLKRCTFLVLDEADRMLDMGFEPQIRSIIDLIRPDRQVTMWSATWPTEVRQLASHYLSSGQDPVHIRIGSSELTANKDVEQKFTICSSKNKLSKFLETIRELNMEYRQANMKKFPKMLIFCNTKVTCNFIATQIKKGGMKAEAIHGGIGQQKRDFMMNGFRRNFFPVLVATDVAARGLDVDNIDYVINFDSPLNLVTYIHRIGRTGRGGKKGTSLTFLTENDGGVVSDIIQCVEAVGQPVDDKLTRLESWWDTKTQEQKEMKKQNKYMEKMERFGNRGLSGYKKTAGHQTGGYGRNRDYRRTNRSYNNDYRDY